MIDQNNPNNIQNVADQKNAKNEENNQPICHLQQIYLKDVSFEQPNSPTIFFEQKQPQVEVLINSETNILSINDGIYECILTATVTTKILDNANETASEKTVFCIEVKQAGIFNIQNIPSDDIDPLLNIHCPTIIFPYLRSSISDIVSRGGFPPLYLAEFNFHALYEAKMKEKEESYSNVDTHEAPITTH